MLATLNDVLPQENENYVVPAFNIFCYEDAKACIEAAEELWIPIILATNSVTIEHMPLPVLSSMLISMAEESSVPVVIHLDHAKDFQTIAKALKYGYSSIMFDGSQLSLKENIKQTKEIVKMSHAFGASVEAEIGTVAYRDKFKHIQQVYTDPKEAAVFAQETKVDTLAVSVGSLHRMEVQQANLIFDLIQQIESKVNGPLVMHGATGIKDQDMKKLIQTAFAKVNIGTALRLAFGNSLREQFEKDAHVYDRMELFPEAMGAVKEVAVEKIKLLETAKFVS